MERFYGNTRKHCYHSCYLFIFSLSEAVACLSLDKPRVLGPALGLLCCAPMVILLL